MLRHREDMEARLAKIRAKEKAQRERYLKGDQSYKKRRTDVAKSDEANGTEEQFVLDDYDSDANQSAVKNVGTAGGGLSAATLELMEKLGMSMNGSKEEEVEADDEMKASNEPLHGSESNLTSIDILLLTNPFPTHTIHQ
jgi:chromosome transmission fidelity protein 1